MVDRIRNKRENPLRVQPPTQSVRRQIDIHPVPIGYRDPMSSPEDRDELVALVLRSRRIYENVRLQDRREQDVVRLGSVILVKTQVRLAPGAAIVGFRIAEQPWRLADPGRRRYYRVPHPIPSLVLGNIAGSS